jgi:hypothetical protein
MLTQYLAEMGDITTTLIIFDRQLNHCTHIHIHEQKQMTKSNAYVAARFQKSARSLTYSLLGNMSSICCRKTTCSSSIECTVKVKFGSTDSAI